MDREKTKAKVLEFLRDNIEEIDQIYNGFMSIRCKIFPYLTEEFSQVEKYTIMTEIMMHLSCAELAKIIVCFGEDFRKDALAECMKATEEMAKIIEQGAPSKNEDSN